MKIGVVTFISDNYGALLQGYALQQVLRNLGYDSEIINREWGSFERSYGFIGKIKKIYLKTPFDDFRNLYLPLSKSIKKQDDLVAMGNAYDTIIVGSDQVWNLDCIKEMGFFYYLDWVPDTVNKITYAVSFGKDSFDVPKDCIDCVRKLIRRFSRISIRENSGVEICNEVFRVPAINLVDPTLLLDKADYERIMPCFAKSDKYICQFLLDADARKSELICSIGKLESLPILDNYPPKLNYIQRFLGKKRFYSVGQWLRNIKEAAYVITDSFHGMVFSIIFKKQFVVINNKKRGSTRFVSLLRKLNLLDRLVDAEIDDVALVRLLHIPIDYRFVDCVIKNEREKSIIYLKEASELR